MNIDFRTALLAGLLLGGCNLTETNDFDLPSDDLDAPEPGAGPIGSPADELAGHNGAVPYSGQAIIPDECVGAPVVGIVNNPEGSCELRELPPEWAWRPMFVDGSPDVQALSLPVPHEFQKYCMYEWVAPYPMESRDQYAQLLNLIDASSDIELDSVAADCMGFKEQGDLNDPTVTVNLRDAFNLNIQAVDAGDLAHTAGYRQPVWLGLLDSVSQEAVDYGIPAHNEHGRYMSSLIGGIACPDEDPSCLRNIHHMLAMPRSDYQLPDWTVGEDYASKVDVAVQIYATVQQWREAKLNQDPLAADRLVINLSLGYNRVNAGVDEFGRGPQAALRTALEFASCHGALVFAASGNVRDENCPYNDPDPLAPAAFEDLPAPTEAECVALGFVPDWSKDFEIFPPPGIDRPLVYAVGGVTETDEPLPNARPHSLPRLVAHGANGVGPDLSMALTGSSVSTAVASATAMLMWSYAPRLRPDQIYELMYDSGWELQRQADFGLLGAMRPIHRVSVCAALDLMCSFEDPNECPQLGCIATEPAADGNLGGYHAAIDDVLSDPATIIEEWSGNPGTPICSTVPQTELVVPQPEQPICANCKADIAKGAIVGDDRLYMTIDASYKGLISDAIFIIQDGNGTMSTVEFDDQVIQSLNDVGVSVVKVRFEGPDTTQGTLDFQLATGLSQSNPIVINHLP